MGEGWKAGNRVLRRHGHSWIVSQTTIRRQKRDKVLTGRRQKKGKIRHRYLTSICDTFPYP